MSLPAPAAPAAGRGAVSYGLLRRDGLHLALPLATLREVVPRPERMEDLPHDVPGLVGAHVLRGRVIPVVDPSALLRGTPDPDRQEIIAVLRHGSSVLGVLADAAEGITTVDPGSQTRMDGSRTSLSRLVFTLPDVEGVVSVLDVAALFDRYAEVAITVAADADMNAVQGLGDADLGVGVAWATGELPLLMTRCDDLGIAIPIGRIDGMQTTSQIDASPVEGGACLGVIRYRDAMVPLVDPLRLLQLGTTTVRDSNECLVVGLDDGLVALLITEVTQLAHVARERVQPLPAFGLSRPGALRGLWDGGDLGRFLLVADDLLAGDEELRALSRMNTSALGAVDPVGPIDGEDGEEAVAGVITEPRTYVTYDCGVEVATVLHEVEAIVAAPAEVVAYDATASWSLGLFDHRGALIPLVDLPAMVGQAPSAPAADPVVLVVRTAGGTVGFRAHRLLSIEPSQTLVVEGQVPAVGGWGVAVPLDDVPYAVLDVDQRMVPVLDLRAVCEQLTAGALAA